MGTPVHVSQGDSQDSRVVVLCWARIAGGIPSLLISIGPCQWRLSCSNHLPLSISRPRITKDGHTAPGDGQPGVLSVVDSLMIPSGRYAASTLNPGSRRRRELGRYFGTGPFGVWTEIT